MKAETGVMHLQAKEHQRLPAHNQKEKRPGKDPFLVPSEHTDLRLWPPEL